MSVRWDQGDHSKGRMGTQPSAEDKIADISVRENRMESVIYMAAFYRKMRYSSMEEDV